MRHSTTWTRRRVLGATLATAAAATLPRTAGAATTLRWATVLPASPFHVGPTPAAPVGLWQAAHP